MRVGIVVKTPHHKHEAVILKWVVFWATATKKLLVKGLRRILIFYSTDSQELFSDFMWRVDPDPALLSLMNN